ncbi:hypothetical protein COL154_013496 [Colletotrichum chrysophilum]|nr:hypothetical protein COL154_013496 [Colletotrichum chrysophilum]
MAPMRRTLSLSPSVVGAFSSLNHQPQDPTEEDYDRVEQLMIDQREEDGNRKSGDYGYKEANPILSKLAQGLIPDATPGLAQALLDCGADVSIAKPKSTNLFKVFSGKDQIEERSDVLSLATKNCSSDILIVLAQDADEQAINEALPVALRIADPIKTSILLAKGADASPHCELFLKCVDSAPIDMHDPSSDTVALSIDATMKMDVAAARLSTLRLLVDGANIAKSEYLQGAAVAAASRNLALDVLKYLSEFITSPTIFSGGLSALTKDGDTWASPKGLYIIQFLLDHGASGPKLDGAMARAACLYNRDAVQLLATATDPASLEQALSFVIAASSDWQLPANLWLIHSLLEWGCEGTSVNQALINAVSAHVEGHDREHLIETLLRVGRGADVNDQGGKVLQIAARRGNINLLKKLGLNNAGRLALTNAFQTLITSMMDQGTALGILDVLIAACQRSRTRFDVEALLPDGRFPVQACIATHSKAEGLARRLIQLGCKANVSIVEAHQLVVKLLEAGAKPGDRDNTGRTALFFASGRGNTTAVQALLKAKAAPNDGSLHEAARNMHSEVIEGLIKAKHEPNFPSSLHEGRTALQELCYRSNCSNISPELEDTIRTLEKAKADPFASHSSMNALFLALNNTRPYHITKALLDIQLWRYINQDNNLFTYVDTKTSIKYAYSATMYFKHKLYRGDPSHIPHLMRLLSEKSCQDRFFAQFEPHQLEALQPAGAVGMPKAVLDEDARRRVDQERRRIRDRDHADRLRREQEEAVHRAEIEGRQHQLRLERQQQTSMLQAAAAAQQAEARNSRRQNQ